MSHKKGVPNTDDKKLFPAGPYGPKAVERMRRYWQDMGYRHVDSPISEGSHEADAIEAKKAKEKTAAWNAKQDAFTRRAIQAKADAAKRNAGVDQESWTDWFSKFLNKKE